MTWFPSLAPNGTNLKPQITGFSWTNSETLHITFAAQSAVGTYTMTIGPQILAADDHSPMDQNINGTLGEVPADEYTGTFSLVFDALQATPGHQSRLDHDGRRAMGLRTSHGRRRDFVQRSPDPTNGYTGSNVIGVNLSATTASPSAAPTT